MKGRGLALAGFSVALAACTSLLGDFSIGGGDDAGDASTDTTTEDVAPDVAPDVKPDAPKDTGPDAPNCGTPGKACCGGNTCTVGACCGTTCIDTQGSGQNCGACGHDCLGGTCTAGACDAQLAGQYPGKSPGRIREHQTNLYWIDDDTNNVGFALTCAKSSCTPSSLFSTSGQAYDLALDSAFANVLVSDGSLSLYECATSGCNNAATQITLVASNGLDGLSSRGDVFGSLDVQPRQFHVDGGVPIDLGNGNEGTNTIVAPPGTSSVYWNGFRRIRIGTAGIPDSGADYWVSGNNENTFMLDADPGYVAWNGDDTNGTNTIYACALGSTCATPTTLATQQSLDLHEGCLTLDPATDVVYWVGTDAGGNHVLVKSCSAKNGCNQTPRLVASVNGTAISAGAVVVDPNFVWFNFSSNGTSYMYRVAK